MKIVVTQRIHAEIVRMLSALGEVVVNEAEEPWARDVLLEEARGADALMVFMPDFIDDAFLVECPKLRIIAAALKGFDNFDVDACRRRGMIFTIVPDLLTEPTAELALALLLGLARNVSAGDARIRSGAFQGWRPVLYGTSLAGKTVGLIGYGAVGRAFERLISGFACRVIWFDQRGGGVALEELLAESDFVLPLLPLTESTFHLVDAAALQKMKGGAYLINVGRGSVVDEEAVADVLEAGHLAGYGADVFEMEDWARADRPAAIPPRLLRMRDRTLFTPHLGSATRAARLAIERMAAQSIVDVLSGLAPRNAL